jgi:hypothetical protein
MFNISVDKHEINTQNGSSTSRQDNIKIYVYTYYVMELHNLYSSPSIIRMIKLRRMRWAGHVARMEEKRNAYRILVRKSEGNKPLGRPRRRWVDNIRMDI